MRGKRSWAGSGFPGGKVLQSWWVGEGSEENSKLYQVDEIPPGPDGLLGQVQGRLQGNKGMGPILSQEAIQTPVPSEDKVATPGCRKIGL